MSKTIFELIPLVMKDVGAIGKNATNKFDKYKYRSIDAVYNALQPVLAQHQIFFAPTVLNASENESPSKSGGKQVRVVLTVLYKVYAPDGSFVECTVQGEGIDRADKASNKALTAAFKYMLFQLFCIAVEGMEDADAETPEMTKTVEPKTTKATNNKSELISDGKYKGKKPSDIPKEELKAYISKVSSALTATGKPAPDWFLELETFIEKAA